MTDAKTSYRAMGFLVWFHSFYRESTRDTYMQIAANYKQCNYVTVRTLLMELEANGYVTVENRGKRAQIIVINKEKYLKAVE